MWILRAKKQKWTRMGRVYKWSEEMRQCRTWQTGEQWGWIERRREKGENKECE